MKRNTFIKLNAFGLIINSVLLVFIILLFFTSRNTGAIGILSEDGPPTAVFLSLKSIYSVTSIIPIFILLITEAIFILNIKFAKKIK